MGRLYLHYDKFCILGFKLTLYGSNGMQINDDDDDDDIRVTHGGVSEMHMCSAVSC